MARLFHWMASQPYVFMFFWPAVCISVIAWGWTQTGERVEDQVSAQWVPTRGRYARDKAYGAEVIGEQSFGTTTLAAMAIARDGGNLYTEDRLNELRERMQLTERVTVEYNDITFTWEDVCLTNGGFPYQLPCARLTSMDYFQEAQWFFDADDELYRRTWYRDLIQKRLLQPILPRFGIMIGACEERCKDVIEFRQAGDPLRLFADVRSLDLSNDCRICIDEEYENIIPTTFQAVREQFLALADKLASSPDAASVTALESNLRKIADNLTAKEVQDFQFYYTARTVYGDLGAEALLSIYAGPALKDFLGFCQDNGLIVGLLGLQCPPLEFTQEEARQAMLTHADADFSSVTTGGVPMPFWGSADGSGALFEGDSPVGGSGVDMSAELNSLETYLSTHDSVNVSSSDWVEQVEKNPLFSWFMAGEELAPAGTKCSNGLLPGTNILGNEDIAPLLATFASTPLPNPFEEGTTISVFDIDNITARVVEDFSPQSCTPYNVPNEQDPGESDQYSRQHFARMWYDLLIVSENLLNITEGKDDPYSWSIGVGCGYDIASPRGFYTGQNESTILQTASRDLYYIDEGTQLGVISPQLLVGDTFPDVGDFSFEYPLQRAGVLQTLYPALTPSSIVDRLNNCKRPGGPVDVTEDEAREISFLWKEAVENVWNKGWDDDEDGDVQFVSFTDDAGVIGSTGRMLREITLSNTTLTVISIALIAVFSVLFMFSFDVVESRVFITLIGVSLVVLSFFAAVAAGLTVGIKIQVTIAWTLPFIILGLGVDDMYIVLQALKEQDGYTESDYLKAMKEVVVPVTMTSINLSDIPAVFACARVALFAVIALYCAIILCFPAYCYLDMQRQAKGRRDLLACGCTSNQGEGPRNKKGDFRTALLYDNWYRPIILGESSTRRLSHALVWLIAIALFGGGLYGIVDSSVGVGLEDFFPTSNPGFLWATARTDGLSAWNIRMRWGALNYTDPSTQMRLIKQFEDVVASSKVAPQDTDKLWMGNLLQWSSRLCANNFDRDEFDTKKCGHDMVSPAGQICSATWRKNEEGLRDELVSDFRDSTCDNFDGGICRKGSEMHPADVLELQGFDPNQSYCPTIDGWSDEQWQFCLVEWRKSTGFESIFALETAKGTPKECSGEHENDQQFKWPLLVSESPLLFAFDMQTHEDTLELIADTRAVCDDVRFDNVEHGCWMFGVPYDYWSQYETIYQSLFISGGTAIIVGCLISFAFLFLMLWCERSLAIGKVLCGAVIGALLILAPMVLSFFAVVGLSSLVGVNLTGFSNMSYVLSVGFSVEYAVHIVSRWLLVDQSTTSSLERVKQTMSFLMLPTFMSFVSSVIGVSCLYFTAFTFNERFFFRPLIIVMFVTYFYGCWWLPTVLCGIEGDLVRMGPKVSEQVKPTITSTVSADSASVADYPIGGLSREYVVEETENSTGFVPGRFEL